MGVLLVAGGSASTIFYYIAAVFVMFFNPNISFPVLSTGVLTLYRKFPILQILPLFVLSLFAFSIARENTDGLLETIASHFQLLFIVPIVVGLKSISANKLCRTYFINGLRIGVLVILPVALLQVVVFEVRPEGFSGNSLVFAFVLCVVCLVGLLQDENQQQQSKLLHYFPSICAFFIIIISFSRAPILIVFALTFLTLLLHVRRSVSLKNFFSLLIFFTVSVTIGVYVIASTNFGARYFETRIVEPVIKLSKGEISDSSIRKRIDLNISGLYAFSQKPIIGYGLQNTVKAANDVSSDALDKSTFYSFSHLHNEYLTYAVAGGFLLLLQYIIIILAPLLISSPGSSREFSTLVTMSFAAIAFTNVVLGHDIMATFFSMCMIIVILDLLNEIEI